MAKYTVPNTQSTISCKAWNSGVEYPSRESEYDIRDSEDNMLGPIFKEDVQGQKHPGRCLVAEAELPSFGKTKYVVQNIMDKNSQDR